MIWEIISSSMLASSRMKKENLFRSSQVKQPQPHITWSSHHKTAGRFPLKHVVKILFVEAEQNN